jgi:hypothetical protein
MNENPSEQSALSARAKPEVGEANPTKTANVAVKIYEPEWLLVNLIRQKRNELERGEVALFQILIEPTSKDIVILDVSASKRIVLAAA